MPALYIRHNNIMCGKFSIFVWCALFGALPLSAQVITNHNSIAQPDLAKPAVGVSFTDPSFNSTIVRITNAVANGMEGVFPDYSKHQAWNAGESLMMLRSGNGDVHFYNGNPPYQYLKTFPSSVQGVQDIFWHPDNPVLLYYVLDNTLNLIHEQTDEITTLHTFTNYAYVTTRAEGNMSNDGRYIALCGYDPDWNPVDFLLYDVTAGLVIGSINVSGSVSGFDWISVSPLGNYVVVDYADGTTGQFHGVEVYDRQFNFLWQQPLGAGHSDLGLDSNGDEVLIMDYYDENDNTTHIKKFRLSDGTVTDLLAVSPDFDLHESCRSMQRPGWVYVSTFDYVGRLTDNSASWLPFEDEVFALKMDGSGDVQRLAHHHSRRYSPATPDSDNSVYFAEPHATVNRNGTRIIWGSNWRQNMALVSSVDAYVCDVTGLIALAAEVNNFPETDAGVSIYPNPFTDTVTITIHGSTLHNATLTICNTSGQVLRKTENLSGQKITIPRGNLASGIWLFSITQDNKTIAAGKLLAK